MPILVICTNGEKRPCGTSRIPGNHEAINGERTIPTLYILVASPSWEYLLQCTLKLVCVLCAHTIKMLRERVPEVKSVASDAFSVADARSRGSGWTSLGLTHDVILPISQTLFSSLHVHLE